MLSKTFLGMPVKNLDGNLFMRITELRGSEFEGLHSIVYASTPHGNTLETGARIETYVIEGKINSQCEINGPAARLMNVGDTVMVLSYKMMILPKAETYEKLKESTKDYHPIIYSAVGNESRYEKNKR